MSLAEGLARIGGAAGPRPGSRDSAPGGASQPAGISGGDMRTALAKEVCDAFKSGDHAGFADAMEEFVRIVQGKAGDKHDQEET